MTNSDSGSNKTRHHTGGGFFKSELYKTYLSPLAFIILSLFLVLFSTVVHAGVLAVGAGAGAVIWITLTRMFRSPSAFFLSVLSVLAMIMLYLWRWTDIYLMPVLSGGITSDIPLFTAGFIEGIMMILLVLLYQKQLNHMKMKITYEWYSAHIYRSFIRLLLYFNVFLVLFWFLGFLAHQIPYLHQVGTLRISAGAAVLAILCAGVPATLYVLKTPAQPHKKHRHSRRRRSTAVSE